jgi:histidine triad (HIT) family protein
VESTWEPGISADVGFFIGSNFRRWSIVTRHPHDPHCIFCKIVRREIPSTTVLETDEAVAFLDIHPVNLGHVLVVPREHHANLTELPDSLSAHVGALLPRLCRAIQAATGADGFNVIINNGRAAGQTVDHGHWHIIPRFDDDAVNWPWPHSEYVGDELSQMRFRIERELEPAND